MQQLSRAWERFWFDREIETSRLAALRVIFFGLLGLDQLYLMVEKGYRYGAGDFNLAHFDILDRVLPVPSAAVHTAIYLICGFLALRIAAGIAVRSSLYVLTVLYSYAYFSSLHDGYQHHYLMAWLLLIAWALPFERDHGVDAEDRAGETAGSPGAMKTVRSWGITLLYAQVAIVYFWTATTKANSFWFNGWALKQQISTGWLRDAMAWVESFSFIGFGRIDMYATTACAVFVWQLLAAVAFVYPRLRGFACITGPIFHIMVEVIGLEIRWFSYYMIAIYYLLLFPNTWYAAIAHWVGRLLSPLAMLWRWMLRPVELSAVLRIVVVTAGALAAAALVSFTPLPGATAVAVFVAAAIILAEVAFVLGKPDPGDGGATAAARRIAVKPGRRTVVRVVFQVFFAILVFAIPRYTDVGYNYYRWQGGDLSRRGELEAAVVAYRHAITLNPGPNSRHAKLARILVQLGRLEEALEVYQSARRLAPDDPRVLRGLADTLQRLGRADEAREIMRHVPRTRRNTGGAAPER